MHLFFLFASLILTSCGQKYALNTNASDEAISTKGVITGDGELEPADPSDSDPKDDLGSEPIVGDGGAASGAGSTTNPMVEEAFGCGAFRLSTAMGAPQNKGKINALFKKNLKYQVQDVDGNVLVRTGSMELVAWVHRRAKVKHHFVNIRNYLDMLRRENVVNGNRKNFKGITHFCTQSDECKLNSPDRLFSLRINAKTGKPMLEGLNDHDLGQRIFDQGKLKQLIPGSHKKLFCKIDFSPRRCP